MGNTCIPVVDSFRYLAKLIHFVKFKNKIKFKKTKNNAQQVFLVFFLTGAKSLKEKEPQEGGDICTHVADSYCLQ